jgi:hypothetical protein
VKDAKDGGTYEGEGDDGLKTSRHFEDRHFDGIVGVSILRSGSMLLYHKCAIQVVKLR